MTAKRQHHLLAGNEWSKEFVTTEIVGSGCVRTAWRIHELDILFDEQPSLLKGAVRQEPKLVISASTKEISDRLFFVPARERNAESDIELEDRQPERIEGTIRCEIYLCEPRNDIGHHEDIFGGGGLAYPDYSDDVLYFSVGMPANAFESLARAIAKQPDTEIRLQLSIEAWSEPVYIMSAKSDYFVEESFLAAVNWASVQPPPPCRESALEQNASRLTPNAPLQSWGEEELAEITASMERMRKTILNIGVGLIVAILIAVAAI